MGNRDGHIELERTVASIIIGRRHRTAFGDIDSLAASIDRDGLLQPITVTPEGVLVCGARRLAAIKQLGWRTVKVWVRAGITDRLGQLLAEQDDNQLHKPLTQTEQAALYRELKALMAEDAAGRQEASRFTAEGQNPRSRGAVESTAPSPSASGDSREQAAQMVTGRNSYNRLEQIGRLQDLASNPAQPEHVRQRAAAELEAIDAGAGAAPASQRINAELSLAELDRLAADESQPVTVRRRAQVEAARVREQAELDAKAAELEALAKEALARAKAASKKRPSQRRTPARPLEGLVLPPRAFVRVWAELDGWWHHYDPDQIATEVSDEDWERFKATVAGTIAFVEHVRTLRTTDPTSTGSSDDGHADSGEGARARPGEAIAV
ncbi:ParB N-terminal domain-containing protein [Nesterenkonia alkaliphila]|uniref:Chromosome partitioning protein ParB n=1 Tax=Nesterenkonia alkaliphila TaxID=1463631 RepID=A0A7K1UIV8_9MICC|nr:ParB N-terminal domain-containing protein [Nesterenkonia alkaliphila]MVT26399.1 chromosome partitioning protein ParB [Nesterenkonia alkaliphila]GFZ82673.1 hypothetical protein GCM10011359_09160 [Nesterenkonia alkaliphila]